MLTCTCATSAVTSSVPNHAIYQANRRIDMPLHISTPTVDRYLAVLGVRLGEQTRAATVDDPMV
jgi:hypothetical protein